MLKRSHIIRIIAIFCLLHVILIPQICGDNYIISPKFYDMTTENIENWDNQIKLARQLFQVQNTLLNKKLPAMITSKAGFLPSKAHEELSSIDKKLFKYDNRNGFISYLRLRSFYIQDKIPLMDKQMQTIINNDHTVVIDTLFFLKSTKLLPYNTKSFCEIVKTSGANLLPVSSIGILNNITFGQRRPVKLISSPNLFAIKNGENLYLISEFLVNSKLFDSAWRVAIEYIYTRFQSPFTSETLKKTWHSSEAAPYWFKASKYARLAGQRKVSWALLTRAAIFSSEKLYPEIKKTAESWIKNPIDSGQNYLQATPSRDAVSSFMKAVNMYKTMGIHPRAWELIAAHINFLGRKKSETLKKEIQSHWLWTIKTISRAYPGMIICGVHAASKVEALLQIRIPEAFSNDSVVEVNQVLWEYFYQLQNRERSHSKQ